MSEPPVSDNPPPPCAVAAEGLLPILPAARSATGSDSTGGQFRGMLAAPELVFLMEAHDGLSARIAEVEGFEALWASGLAMATALGVRDVDEASWSQLLDVVNCMVEATSIPIIVDGAAGYGNYNTARRFSRKVERIGAAGVCFEDKKFPKINSFVGDDHELVELADFTALIKACVEYRHEGSFCIIARTEALIAGRGMAEAMKRAEAYRQAGADALFIHSRLVVADEIVEFASEWADRLPLIIAPTTYGRAPTDTFRRCGVSAVIWANHSLRAAISAMRRACYEIRQRQSASHSSLTLASLGEIFDLMNYAELTTAGGSFSNRKHRDYDKCGEFGSRPSTDK